MKTAICGFDARIFDGTVVSIDGSIEFGPIVRLKFANGSLWAEASMKPEDAMNLSAALKRMADEVTRA